jgi:uncharacterized membrane protein
LAIVTRTYGFGKWDFVSDEFYTVDDAINGNYSWPFKAGYYALTARMFEWFGVSEWSARLPAVIFGTAGVPVFYLLSRRFLGTGVAIIGSLFVLFNGWHLDYSQYARFYSAVFLFGMLTYFLYYEAIRSGKLGMLILSLGASGFGIVFHQTSIVAFGCCLVFSIVLLLFLRDRFPDASVRLAKIHLVIAGVGTLVALPGFIRLASRWSDLSDAFGYGPFNIFLQTGKYVGIPVSAAAIFGLVLLLRRDLPKGIFVAISCGLPVVMLVGASAIMSARPDYLFYAVPMFFVAAAYFCEVAREHLSANRLASIGVAVIVIAGLAPEFMSYYTGRMTIDKRDAISYVTRHAEEGDKIVSLMGDGGYYWPEDRPKQELPGNAYVKSVDWEVELQPFVDAGQKIWIIVPVKRKRIAPNLQKWLGKNAHLVWQKQSKRYDYTYDALQVFVKP